MKKVFLFGTILALMLVLAACGGGSENPPAATPDGGTAAPVNQEADYDTPIVLRFGTHLTDNHVLTLNAVIPFMERVTELTDGQVTFEHYSNSQMGKATDAYDLVSSGVLDISYTLYMTEDLPLSDICSLPNLYEDCEYATYAYWQVLNQEPFAGLLADLNIKPVMCVAWEPYTISTVRTQPTTLEDFAKLKLRSSGGLHDQAANALGITPVSISASETLEALQKNTVDGCWSSTTAKNDYQWTQVLQYSITNLPFPGWGGFFAMNREVYLDLPSNVREAIDQASEEMALVMGAYVKEMCEEAWDICEEAGMVHYQVSEDVVEQIREALEPISQDWLSLLDGEGHPATEVYNQFKDAYNSYL